MGKTLVVVESPGKIKKLQQFLGSNYVVKASVGHILDLPSKGMNIDIENDYEPTYAPYPEKKAVISELRKAAKGCDEVILATDRDREGEMIAWSVAEILKLKQPKRMTFTAITRDDVKKALDDIRTLDYHMIDAQKARRILDRLVGYELSPVLWAQLNMQGALSAGRVQSVVVRVIVDREIEIEKFWKQGLKSQFRVEGTFLDGETEYTATMQTIKRKKAAFETVKTATTMMKKLAKAEYTVGDTSKRSRSRNPSPPFTTNTMQQEASSRLHFNPKRAMMAAQHLYEAGLITYMRTDSICLSKDAMKQASKYIVDEFGKKYHKSRVFAGGKNTQEAHEAIRPVSISHREVGTNSGKKIGYDEIRLYELIWRRTVASQMTPATYDVYTAEIEISNVDDHLFVATAEILTFDGFLRVYRDPETDEKGDQKPSIPESGVVLDPAVIEAKQQYDSPPARYTYPALLKKLDPRNLNIGRPATYASMIATITEKRKYVEIEDVEGQKVEVRKLRLENRKLSSSKEESVIGNEKSRFVPQPIGRMVNDYLVTHFPKVMDYQFTAGMEEALDAIAGGQKDWVKVVDGFYQEFHPTVVKLKKEKPIIEDKFTRKLGTDEKGRTVFATVRRYGPVFLRVSEDGKKQEFAKILPPLKLEKVTLDDAVDLFAYPKSLGQIDGEEATLCRGRFGFYYKVGTMSLTVPKGTAEEDMTLEQAEELRAEKIKNTLGHFTDDSRDYTVLRGRYGIYVRISSKSKANSAKKKTDNVKLPADTDTDSLTLEELKKLIEEGYERKRAGKKAPVKKTVTKKSAAKKPVTEKNTVAKKAPVKKKTAAKKASAEKPTKKPVTEKKPAKKPVKKPVTEKKAPVKKTVANKAPAKKKASAPVKKS